MEKDSIEFLPIGGLGEIGRNMMLVKSAKDSFLIDAGVQFPHDTTFNLKYLVSNFKKNLHLQLKHLVVTHAHEDHIGAIPYLLTEFPYIKIHCKLFASEVIKSKIYKKFHGNITVYDNEPVKIGDFNIKYIHVNHSIPETTGLFITSAPNDFCALFISDFKIEKGPLFEPAFMPRKLKALVKDYKNRFLFLDSTNILQEKETQTTEKEVYESLKKIIKKEKRRIFITLFASNLHRTKGLIEIAEKEKRPIFYAGRAIEHFISLGKKCGIISNSVTIEDYDQYSQTKHKNPIFLLTGCQGDFRGALGRISSSNDAHITLNSEDLFIFSSKTIPGNEIRVNRIINDLSRQGCNIITSRDDKTHSSGHATRGDIKNVIKYFSPTHLIPIHGEYFFLKRHCDYLRLNYKQIEVIQLNNQDHLSFYPKKKKYKLEQQRETLLPIFMLDNDRPIQKKDLNVRKKMALYGTLFLSINFPKKKVNDISIMGTTLPKDERKFYNDFSNRINNYLIKEKFDLKKKETIQESIRIFAQKTFKQFFGEKTIIVVHVIY